MYNYCSYLRRNQIGSIVSLLSLSQPSLVEFLFFLLSNFVENGKYGCEYDGNWFFPDFPGFDAIIKVGITISSIRWRNKIFFGPNVIAILKELFISWEGDYIFLFKSKIVEFIYKKSSTLMQTQIVRLNTCAFSRNCNFYVFD